MPDFDFLTDAPQPEVLPPFVGPNLQGAVKMTPRKFAQAVLEVFNELGGASWLMTQAIADPKSFLELLKKLIPKSVQLEDLQGLQINLIDQFGNQLQIQTGASPEAAADAAHLKSGQLQSATGGNLPPLGISSSQEEPSLPDNLFEVKDTF